MLFCKSKFYNDNMLNSKVLKIYLKFCYFIVVILCFIITTSCQINPASGEKEFTLMSKDEEKSIGKSEHQKIIKQFGGVYQNEKLNNYVKSLGDFLVSTSELSDQEFSFTILDTHIVNAFALPGGYIYITRGLLALCKNEAQLAGVLAHEIGHVTARHSARRYTRVFSTGVIANIINVLAKNNYGIGNLVGQTANLYLLSYSREQEFEADKLALRNMSKAGFKVEEMGGFLNSMENFGKLFSEMNLIKSSQKSDLLSTHPLSSRRINRVISESKKFNIASPITGRELYLKKIDGINFGDKPEGGTIFRNHFIHPTLKIGFEFNSEFYFLNKPNFIIGYGPDKSKIILDVDLDKQKSDDILIYTKKILGRNFPSTYSRSIINDFEYIDISYKKSKNNNRLAVIKDGNKYFRLFLIEDQNNPSQITQNSFQKILRTFKKIDIPNKKVESKKILKIINVKEGETKEKISNLQMVQPRFSLRLFEIINGLQGKDIEVGQNLKFITGDHY